MDPIYKYAIKLLTARDYTVKNLHEKLQARFGTIAPGVIEALIQKKYLNDRRFAENYVARRKSRGPSPLREELAARGVPGRIIDEILSETDWPSLQEALTAKMNVWHLRAPLQPRDAARLFRALHRLGYEEDEILEALDQMNER